jgi:hypothetical protein
MAKDFAVLDGDSHCGRAARNCLAPRRPRLAADRGNASAINCNVAAKGRPAGPVDDRAAPNDNVVHGSALDYP